MKRVFLWVGLGLIFVMVTAYAGKNFFLKKWIQWGAWRVTGMTLAIDSLKLRPFSSSLQIEGTILLNPSGYEDKHLMNLPEIYGQISIPHLLKKEIYLRDVRVNVKEFLVVKNKKGELNVQPIITLFGSDKKKPQPTEKSGSFYIKRLELSIERVAYKDYSRGGEPETRSYDINLNKEVYYDIKNFQTFLSVLLTRAITESSIDKVLNLDMEEMKGVVQRQHQKNWNATKEGAQGAWDLTKEGVQDAWDATKQKTSETTQQIENLLEGN